MFNLLLILSLLLSLTGVSTCQELVANPQKLSIGVYDFNRIFNSCQEGNGAELDNNATIRRELSQYFKQRDELLRQLDDIEMVKGTLGPSAKAIRQKLDGLRHRYSKILEKEIDKCVRIIVDEGETELDLIFNKSYAAIPGSVLFIVHSRNVMDVTDLIISKLNSL